MLWLFRISAAYSLIVPIVAVYFGIGSQSLWALLIAGITMTVLSKIDHLSEFALGPLRAKIRQSVDEANATVLQLQELACKISEVVLTSLMAGNFGFQDGLNLRSRIGLHSQVLHSLRELQVPEGKINQVNERWRDGIGVIYFRQIGNLIDGSDGCLTNSNATPEEKRNADAWSSLLELDGWKAPKPDNMRHFMRENKISKPEIFACIDDYDHYLETDEIRRIESFVNF